MAEFLTIDELLTAHSVSDAQLHPAGRLIAYTVTDATVTVEDRQGSSAIWLVDEGDQARSLTAPGTYAHHPRWSPSGAGLAFIGKRAGEELAQLHLLDAGWGEARALTSCPGGVSGFAWSPDGNAIAVLVDDPPPDDEEERKQRGQDWLEFERQDRFTRLWRYDVAGARLEPVPHGDLHVHELSWSPDGAQIVAIVAARPYGWAWYSAWLVVIDMASSVVRELYRPEKQIARPSWSPDGASIALISCTFSDPGMTGGEVLLIHPVSGAFCILTKGHPRSYLAVEWDADGSAFLSPAYDNGQAAIYRVGLDSTAEQLWRAPVALQAFMADALTRDRTGTRLAVVRHDPDNPGDVWSGELHDGAINWRRRTDQNPGFGGRAVVEVQELRWPSEDGLTIQGLFLRPAQAPRDTPLPTITVIHGGPTSLTPWGFADARGMGWAHLLAARGFACFMPNYRGSMGFGNAFAEANVGDLGGGDLDDVLTGVDYCVAQGLSDPDRLGVMGWSYGGYLTPWAVTQTQRFKAAISGASITNWTSQHGGTAIPAFDVTFIGADPFNADGFYTFRSPVYNIHKVRTPVLFLHGGEDPVCPVGQAYEMCRALREQGVEAEAVVYPREGHSIREREHLRDMLGRIVTWFSERV